MEMFAVRLSPELKNAIDQTAQKYRLSTPNFVRALLAIATQDEAKLFLEVSGNAKPTAARRGKKNGG